MKKILRNRFLFLVLSFFLVGTPPLTEACDICAISSAVAAEDISSNKFRLGVSEQITLYEGTSNNFKQNLDSYVTQVFASYALNDLFFLQLTLPYIYRDYKRLELGRPVKGTESGLGDASVLMRYQAYRSQEAGDSLFAQLFAGLKLGTGDADLLKEEREEESVVEQRTLPKHGGVGGNLVDGADLALGTGSTDYIVGGSFRAGRGEYFLKAAIQYTFRSKGDFGFRYGDDLNWEISPGMYLYAEHSNSLAVSLRFSGESQNDDELDGVKILDSDINRSYLGPEFLFNFGENWQIDFSADFPLEVGNQEQSVEPEMRYRFKLLRRF